MGKIKTHKASAKRFSVTAGGKIKMNHSHHRHNLGIKTAKRKRSLRKGAILSASFTPTIRTLIQK
jgi:large subunit ribosomal protein L35